MKTWCAAAVLILAHVALLWHSATRTSATVDELSHLAGGLYAVNTGDFRITRVDPPFQNVFCALFAHAFNDYQLDYDNESWNKGIWNGSGDRLLEANPENFHSLLLAGRIGSMILSSALCMLIFIWTRMLWGPKAGLCVLALTVFEPNLLAHGRLITTDAGTMLFYLLTGFCCWRFYHKPSWVLLALTGAAAAGAWLCKHSGMLLFPILFITFLTLPTPAIVDRFAFLQRFSKPAKKITASFLMLCVAFASGFFTIWAGYAFEVGDSIPDRLPKDSELWLEFQYPILLGAHLLGIEEGMTVMADDPNEPLWAFLSTYTPAFSHWEGYFATRNIIEQGHLGYLMGRFSYSGFFEYYPVLFLVKTPVPLLLILFCGAAFLARHRVAVARHTLLSLTLIPGVYLVILMLFNTAAIGYRHALPILPFLLVLFAGAAASFVFQSLAASRPYVRTLGASLVALIAWCVIESVSLHPHYLTYFNQIAGGPENGRVWGVDSNLDWGQDLLTLKDYLEEHELGEPYLFYFGPKSLPDAYDVPHRTLKDPGPLPQGTYIIGATFLQGVGSGSWTPHLEPFRRREPDAYITPALLLYEKRY